MLTKTKQAFSKFLDKSFGNENADIEKIYGDFSIRLPAGHRLPLFQLRHPKYDRFLPHAAKYLEKRATVIDVGANCGDTLAAMVDFNQQLDYVCIEPDDRFFDFLTSNIEVIQRRFPALQIQSVKSLVGQNVNNVSLEGTGGTKHAVVGSGTQQSRSLDAICAELALGNVRLLKSDVDGFDYDILDSAHATIAAQHPLLFFECQCDFDYQKAGYTQTMAWLQSAGYGHWTVFDNFGEVLLRTGDITLIFQLMEYTWRQHQKTSTRTIYYYDILAHAEPDSALVDEMLRTY
ncbi:MAG: hypothetical protein JWP29_4491 [Rhodoferax sp.]|nr:hypothetical protein [Rhodoferax sp.]